MDQQLVIIGASYAGVQVAASAREGGFSGPIVLVGDEAHAPYQRPPLSKGFLTGKDTPLALKGPDFYAQAGIAFRPSSRVSAIDRTARLAILEDGEQLPYDFLALATGARCRTLACEGAQLAGVHYLRNLDDALHLSAAANSAQCIVIVGGGFIGLEVAASLRTLGKQVTVIEAAERLLCRVSHPVVARFLHDMHASKGVAIHTAAQVSRLLGQAGRVNGVELDDGRRLACDLVVVGIGVVANDELAAASGLAVDNGIIVDSCARTSDPAIVAAGDCARYPNPWALAASVRLESVQSANDLARAAAATVCGRPEPYRAVPWFWSDQYACKLQMAGVTQGWDRVVLRGAPASGRFSLFYSRQGSLIGVDTVNQPGVHMLARKLLASRAQPSEVQLGDPDFDLSTLLLPSAPSRHE
jgi:3-phenylpropionate/trans-cinnamate dioxygenase ferredoxin reductase subunit